MGLAAGAIAVTVIGTAVSIDQQKKSQRLKEKSDAVANAQIALQNDKTVRQALAKSSIDRARLIAQGETQTGGFSGSSSVQGALGSARTQVAANIGFANQTLSAQNRISALGQASNRALVRGGIGRAVAGLPGEFGLSGGDIIQARKGN